MEFIDHTNNWPVFKAASEWNKTPKLIITYRYGSAAGCPNDCGGVDVKNLGSCGNPYGRTNPQFSSRGHLTGATNVRFNGQCRSQLGDFARRELVCHELGHAAGWIGHRSGSCMRTGALASPFKRFPSTHDFNMFKDPLYDHND